MAGSCGILPPEHHALAKPYLYKTYCKYCTAAEPPSGSSSAVHMICGQPQLLSSILNVTGLGLSMVHALTNSFSLCVPGCTLHKIWPPGVCAALPRALCVDGAQVLTVQEDTPLHVQSQLVCQMARQAFTSLIEAMRGKTACVQQRPDKKVSHNVPHPCPGCAAFSTPPCLSRIWCTEVETEIW